MPTPTGHVRLTTYTFPCLQCGRLAPGPSGRPLLVAVLSGHRVRTICPRCETCGGRCYPQEQDTVAYRCEPVARVEESARRRGRPPRWITEQRRRDADERLARRTA